MNKKTTIIEAQNSNTVFENKSQSGILGKLKGVFADYKHGTRNSDRLYPEELWDNRVFGSEDVMEALETKTLFGELDHPEGDRCETLAKNAAISITKLEKRPDEGVIYGEAEILDTPTGRIVKALADSGAQLGVSSRGMGEEMYVEGKNIIDPETYDFITFDVVVTPANTKARVALTESKHLDKLNESLSKELKECETENQINQIKTVVENTSNSKELLSMVENKMEEVNKSKNDKLTEANKQLALEILTNKLTETKTELGEVLEASNSLADENSKLVEEKNFYKDSKQELKSIIKETKSKEKQYQREVNTLKAKYKTESLKNISLESSLKELQENLNISTTKIEESKTNTTKAIEQNNKLNNKKIVELENKHLEESKKLNKKLENLQKANKDFSDNYMKAKTLIEKLKKENEELKVNNIKIEENLKANSKIILDNKKLQESKTKQQESKMLSLQKENKILKQQLEEANKVEEQYSKLAFDPVGTVKVLKENSYTQEQWTEEDREMFNILTHNN